MKARWKFIITNVRGQVLDLGCSYGDLHNYVISKNPTSTVVGLDILPSPQKETFCIGSVTDLPFAANSFDTVIAGEIIEHLDNPEKLIQESHRVLRKNGYLIITTPIRGSYLIYLSDALPKGLKLLILNKVLRHRNRLEGYEKYSEHKVVFDRKTLTDNLNKNGFTIQQCKTMPHESSESIIGDMFYSFKYVINVILPKTMNECQALVCVKSE